jgi:hypothetical protein
MGVLTEREFEATGKQMKKASILFVIVVFSVCAGFLFGQETPKPYTYTFDNGVGECIFIGVSLDQLWSAAVKTLMQDKFKIVLSDKQSRNITAERRPMAAANYDLTLFFEQRGQDVCITASVAGLQGIRDKKAEHKLEKNFFDKVTELLYGKVEKK